MEAKIQKLKEMREKAEKEGNVRLKESLENKIEMLSNSKTVTK